MKEEFGLGKPLPRNQRAFLLTEEAVKTLTLYCRLGTKNENS
jgi:hypothetical protein